jgi:hypothetical protein
MSVKMAEGQGVRTVIWIGTEECNHAAIELGVERQAPCPHGSIVHDQSYLDLRV